MDLRPRGYEKAIQLVAKGVCIPNPLSIDIGEEVDLDRISGDSVTIFPGCRIYGGKTAISAGAELGGEAPVTVDECRLGPRAQLKGGYFKHSVFLEKASLGSGAQVREACLLEEESGGAHCVGLKQTILFPFVTLGSLINFCDCFMAGGTSRKDHSEVGSSYIHFNFTPEGDKTTPSLFGDVPRGVMLDRPPIFLGGQGGGVGPLRVGYGTVVAAGSILRDDILDDEQLVVPAGPRGIRRSFARGNYPNLTHIVRNNAVYLANLVALEHWYTNVRRPFFARQALGDLIYEGALEMIALAKEERQKRLRAMAGKVPDSAPGAIGLRRNVDRLCGLFDGALIIPAEDEFLSAFEQNASDASVDYVATIQSLPPALRSLGVQWLTQIVDTLCSKADQLMETMDLFSSKHR